MARPAPASHALPAATTRRLAGLLSAVLFIVLATLGRIWLGKLVPGLTIFSLYYPAVLGAALVGGETAAALALALSLAISWRFLEHIRSPTFTGAAVVLNLVLFSLAAAFIGAVGARLRTLLMRRAADIERLADREARYRALFEGVSEGFSLMEGVWGADGRLADLLAVEANPAILKMFSIERPVVGVRQSELVAIPMPEYLPACERAFRGERVRLEVLGPRTGRWFEIRLTRAGENRLAQIVVDVTENKAAETRQSEMFDELNHRVKNNLSAVSAMLGMQARVAQEAQVREQLQTAVDRIQTIGDVHASLYRGGSAEAVDFGAYLRRLCERLATTLVDNDRIRIEVQAAPVTTPLERAVALGLIVNELVTNAAKHAYPPPQRGVIEVALRETADGLELSVSDDGQGLPQELPSRGIGMRLVRSLVQQCRGELEVQRDGGTRFIVRLREGVAQTAEDAQTRLL